MVGMQKRLVTIAFALALAVFAVACGGSDDKGGGILSGNNAPSSAGADVAPTTTGQTSRPPGGSAPATVDVCALFNADDAKAVVLATKSGPGTDTKLTMTKETVQSPTLGSCKMQFDGTPTGTIQVQALPAGQFWLYKSDGKSVSGIGDEAVSVRGTTYVRVGQVMLTTGENSFTETFAQEVYKKMAPRLK
jgi:hypothetical protein